MVVVAIAAVAAVVLSSGGDGAVNEALLMTGGSLIGDPDAPVTLVEFADFQ